MAQLKCIVVTPEKTVLEQEVSFVVVPLYDGEIGVAPGRQPMIGRLGFGEMRLHTNGQVDRYYVDGGFVQVENNVVSVLTSRALPASEIDEGVAAEQLQSATKRPANKPELMEIRDRTVDQARAQIRVARRAK